MLWRAGNATLTLTPPLNLWLAVRLSRNFCWSFFFFFFFSLPLVIWSWWLFTWVDMLPKQNRIMSWCLHSHITYITYWSLVCCYAFSYKIKSVTRGAWRTLNRNVRRTPKYLLEQKEFRIRFTSSQSESISLTEPEMSVYCFSRIFSHLPPKWLYSQSPIINNICNHYYIWTELKVILNQ